MALADLWSTGWRILPLFYRWRLAGAPFWKMLYNAQLVSLYSHAYQSTKNPLYKTIVYETLILLKKS
jgi:uncharacterized protein YyaL (SSP411 family)